MFLPTRNYQYCDYQINRGSQQFHGLRGVVKAIPGKGLMFLDIPRGKASYYQPVNSRSIPQMRSDYSVWDAVIPNADTESIAFTSSFWNDSWTALIWFYAFSINAGGSEYATIIGRSDYTGEANNGGWSWVTTDFNDPNWPGELGCALFDDNSQGAYGVESNVATEANKFYMLGNNFGYDRDRRFHINGALVASENTAGQFIIPDDTSGALGAGGKLTASHNGFIEARFYGRQLSDAEVDLMFRQDRDELWRIQRSPSSYGANSVIASARSQVYVMG